MVLKVDMWHKTKYYIVGVYEDLEDNIYPSHFNPIIAEKKDGLYRRWNYSIQFPYQIKLNSPVGTFKKNYEELFPVKTLHYIKPVELSSKTQVIALSRDRIIASENKAKLVFQIMKSALTSKTDIRYLHRAVRTIKNIIE